MKVLKKVWESGIATGLQHLVCRFFKAIRYQPPPKWKAHLAIPDVFQVVVQEGVSFKMSDTGLRIEKSMYWQGIYGHEPTTMAIFLKLLDTVDWVVDIGANTGLFALAAKSKNSAALVYAFEPMPFFYRFLVKNNAINRFNIQTFQKAVSDEEATLKFYIPEKGQGNLYSSTLKEQHYFGHQQTIPRVIEVAAMRLDRLFEQEQPKGKGILKIDAEGSDYEVIKSMGKMLEYLQPLMIVENRSKEMALKMVALPGMKAYRFLSIPDLPGEKAKWLQEPVDDKGRNILFIPEKDHEATLSTIGYDFIS